ncbi:MAG: GDP-fucose synthetase [Lentisphaerae bacterium GWF2_52_8]|nr:MAG: GDP-fucose synthetase [Lentisphaerae bacterium GWF2_52_8]
MGLKQTDRIFVAGHRGMVGSSILRLFQSEGYPNLITRTRSELDLADSAAVESFFRYECPEVVILAAAKVGGIKANMEHPAEFLRENLCIQSNVIHQAWKSGVKKLCFLGSSCIYPRECPQPIKEEYLLTGPLEPTNEGYAIAKIAGYKMCLYYSKEYGFDTISLMPCNLYGTNDDFNLETCHVLSALVRRFVDAADCGAAEISLWGTGTPRREFMHVDDLAAAVLFMLDKREEPEVINVGTGTDITIAELAKLIANTVGYCGKIKWESSSVPDGMPRKCMDVSRMLDSGFQPRIGLKDGIIRTIAEYRERKAKGDL